ncbi:MAG: prenyltransferase [Pirellulales bacterium]|nr:prenyltransferase [Pirellulales bacterium]
MKEYPNIFQMARAPFFTALLSPLVFGTLLACHVDGRFEVINFLLMLVIGIGLHTATNVYNDIYDTEQGADEVNVHRNEFSGGSGILVRYPELTAKMYMLARAGLILSLLGTIALTFFVDRSQWPMLWALFFVSAFLSKYYTAAPVKLAYRGLGEIAVLFSFGPMAMMLAYVSQNTDLCSVMITAMPIGGLSTVTILLMGELIDLPADKQAGKLGIAPRLGSKATAAIYAAAQAAIVLNVIAVAVQLEGYGWPLFAALLPYVVIFPRIIIVLKSHHNDPQELMVIAKANVQLHLLFSLLLNLSMLLISMLW